MTDRVEVAESTWRDDAPRDQSRRLSMLLFGTPNPSSETSALLPDCSQLDVSGPGGQASERERSGRGGTN